jgi:plasmid stabilization system protein ParE
MAFRVELTPRAERDVAELFAWYQERSPDAARRWYLRVVSQLASLDHQPERCALAPESVLVERTIRQLFVGRRKVAWFRALFECRGDAVVVLRLRRCTQDELPADELLGPDADLPDVEPPPFAS